MWYNTLRGAGYRFVSIVLVVVLVIVIEKAEYGMYYEMGVEDDDEYKDEYELPMGRTVLGFSYWILVTGFGSISTRCNAHSLLIDNSDISEKSDDLPYAKCAMHFQSAIRNLKSEIEKLVTRRFHDIKFNSHIRPDWKSG
jgi:hypothetical protein